jgi:hypothetical protein
MGQYRVQYRRGAMGAVRVTVTAPYGAVILNCVVNARWNPRNSHVVAKSAAARAIREDRYAQNR